MQVPRLDYKDAQYFAVALFPLFEEAAEEYRKAVEQVRSLKESLAVAKKELEKTKLVGTQTSVTTAHQEVKEVLWQTQNVR